METTFLTRLKQHKRLSDRKEKSEEKLAQLGEVITDEKSNPQSVLNSLEISLFGAGSIGRKEIGAKSDLDIFIIADKSIGSLDKYKLFAKIIEINNRLSFPDFSNDGQFLKIHELESMIKALGSPNDDSENFFTARMLLILEGIPLCNGNYFEKHLNAIVSNYFRDASDHNSDFRPLFLLNDLLRYWRTLCLNYEQIRNRQDRPWRKKNINLKFSRMLTVFATVLALIVRKTDVETFKYLCRMTPLERLANALDTLDATDLHDRFQQFLDDYEFFLSLKEQENIEQKIMADPTIKARIDSAAERFSDFLYSSVTHQNIPEAYRRFLVI
jgi:predicted nucleotidyltransferase